MTLRESLFIKVKRFKENLQYWHKIIQLTVLSLEKSEKLPDINTAWSALPSTWLIMNGPCTTLFTQRVCQPVSNLSAFALTTLCIQQMHLCLTSLACTHLSSNRVTPSQIKLKANVCGKQSERKTTWGRKAHSILCYTMNSTGVKC